MPPPTNIFAMTPKIFLQVRPYVHEHLQHWIDQDEDHRGGGLNFCSYHQDYREISVERV